MAAQEVPPPFHHPMDISAFRKHGHELVDWIADYYETIEKHPVRSQVEPGYLAKVIPQHPPKEGESFSAIMSDVEQHIVPGITHWQHPSYFAYFSANSSTPGMLGEMLSACFNVIGFSWITSPACTELEVIALDWLAQLYNLPPCFLSSGGGGGVIQGTASEATVVAVLTARTRAVKEEMEKGEAKTEGEVIGKLVAYASDQSHSSMMKACRIAGLTSAQVRFVPTEPETQFRLCEKKLNAMIEEDKRAGHIPFFCLGTVGTTSSTAIDNIDAIGTVCNSHHLYFHVDAAFAGNACVCPEFQSFFKGIEKADSLDTNPHKWMLTNFDCSTMWVKNKKILLDALSITPEYLRNKQTDSGAVIDYRDWQIPLGRRFRALKLWMVMRAYGVEGLRAYIRHHVSLAETFEKWVREDDRFEITAERVVSLVCFRIKGPKEINEKLMERINETGKAFLTHTVLPPSTYSLRVAVNAANVQFVHVHNLWMQIKEITAILLAENPPAPAP